VFNIIPIYVNMIVYGTILYFKYRKTQFEKQIVHTLKYSQLV